MSLVIDSVLIIDDQKARSIVQYMLSQEAVTEWTEQVGATSARKPTGEPPYYSDDQLANIEDPSLAQKMMMCGNWASYFNSWKTLLDGRVKRYEAALQTFEREFRKNMRKAAKESKEKLPAKEEMEDVIKTHPIYLEMQKNLLDTLDAFHAASDSADRQKKNYQTLSRTLTLRGQEIELSKGRT